VAAVQQAPARSHSQRADSPARAQRLRAGISIETLCERTKISRQYIEAIDAREYTRLPGGVFNVNYVRQYAEGIGYPPLALLADYRQAMDALLPPPSPPTPRTQSAVRVRPHIWLRLAFRRLQRWLAPAPARNAS